MSPETAFVVAEHPVADRESRDAAAHGGNLSGKFVAENRSPRLDRAVDHPEWSGPTRAVGAIRSVHRRCVHPDQDVVGPSHRGVNVQDPDHRRRTVPGLHGSLHGRTVAPPVESISRSNPKPGRATASAAGYMITPAVLRLVPQHPAGLVDAQHRLSLIHISEPT